MQLKSAGDLAMKNDDYIFGDDQPKKNPWQDDRLGYAPFAKRIANIAINMDIPNGYVIGLHGRWGSGKTTAVNFVLEYLKKHNQETEDNSEKVEHIEFRPWIVSGHQDLMATFFKLLSEHLGPSESKAKRGWSRSMTTVATTTDELVNAAATLALTIDPSGGAVAGLIGGLGSGPIN
jgi:predicted KAP-like P-loop ATPase